MKCIAVRDAKGRVLCRDITREIDGAVKDTPYRKGRMLCEEDVPLLASLGIQRVWVWEAGESMLRADEAEALLAASCVGEGIHYSALREGGFELAAKSAGLFRVDSARLDALNELGSVVIASRHNNYPVQKGDRLLYISIAQPFIEREKLELAEKLMGEGLAKVLPYKRQNAGIVSAGNEIFSGRAEDTATPVLRDKLLAYDFRLSGCITCADDAETIAASLAELERDSDVLLCAGTDDNLMAAVEAGGATLISRGMPVFPGQRLIFARYPGGAWLIGLPGKVFAPRAAGVDILLPRLAAGLELTAGDIAHTGAGGLCLGCKECRFPDCGFGKGV